MKTGGKYRFNLGFSANSVEGIRAGELLESLGQKKSVVVVAALNEYLDRHPELTAGGKLEIQMTSITPENLETMVRRILSERTLAGETPVAGEERGSDGQNNTDIIDMLNDLDFFS